jgi:hypothetical protein
MDNEQGILIAGGYGIVGEQIARLIRQRHPRLPLILAGRNPAKAEALAKELGNTTTARVDMEQPHPLNGLKPRAVLAAVNDPRDDLLMGAARAGIPYVDITRWTERLRSAASRVGTLSLQAPVMFASSWMAGVAAVVAVAASRQLKRVNSIDLAILFSLKDKSGPNSIEYMDRLATPFEVMIGGQPRQVRPYTDPRRVAFPGGHTANAYRFDTPDQLTLPGTTGAQTVAARLAFDDATATALLVFLTRSGIWKLISGARFTGLRRSLLYNPGAGASHELVIEAAGLDENGHTKNVRATVADPQGQTHLTALGAIVQLERVLGLDGAPPPAPGVVYPDSAPQVEFAFRALRDFQVEIEVISSSA